MSHVSMKKQQLHSLLLRQAVRFGEFTLASGQTSNVYFDSKRVTLTGAGHALLGALFFDAMVSLEDQQPFHACGGIAIGAVPIASALCMTAAQASRELPICIVRKEKKGHGTEALVEGTSSLPANARIVLVEDVITTGNSTLIAAKALRANGFVIDHAMCILDRSQGQHVLAEHGMTLTSLFQIDDFIAKHTPKEAFACVR
jgi:orotate phosphoribosyltransferase